VSFLLSIFNPGGMMIQISYISTAPNPLSSAQLLELLQQCLSNNRAQGVTGMLLYGNETFLQALEGEDETVDRLYDKIAKDPRHANIVCLSRKSIDRRQYADWTMGFKRLSDGELQHIEGFKDFTIKDFTTDFLSRHGVAREKLMDHFSYWDPLVRAVEEKDHAIRSLKQDLAMTRGSVEVARLVLESIADACRNNSVSDAHLRLCESTLETLG